MDREKNELWVSLAILEFYDSEKREGRQTRIWEVAYRVKTGTEMKREMVVSWIRGDDN